ncbi:UDP-N-acetylglucosamine pyrophosphorylase [Candidatus Magnetomoraceae bacterium gMMP-15]
MNKQKIKQLLNKGVQIPCPESIEIGDEVDIERISDNGVIIHTGCKIFGSSTFIMQGTELGYEAPVTIENCQLGSFVKLKGGFFKEAVFLEKSSMGSGAHVRQGTILEEEANGAHTVALKQTILFPFVTLGSLINFCDCLMTGGTSRKDHSEVGSSYIHFNYTPDQDKATPSIMGDVPKGVMLDQRSIFLGGQGGLAGPCRLAYGTVIAAGSIHRHDEKQENMLLIDGIGKSGKLPFSFGSYAFIKRIFINNIFYIANLIALRHWYKFIRSQFVGQNFPQPLYQGLTEKLDMAVKERIKRLKALSEKMPNSIKINPSDSLTPQKIEFYQKWDQVELYLWSACKTCGDNALRDTFIYKAEKLREQEDNYIRVIKELKKRDKIKGRTWLQGIVDEINKNVFNILQSYR